jgi:hypothetical protein
MHVTFLLVETFAARSEQNKLDNEMQLRNYVSLSHSGWTLISLTVIRTVFSSASVRLVSLIPGTSTIDPTVLQGILLNRIKTSNTCFAPHY